VKIRMFLALCGVLIPTLGRSWAASATTPTATSVAADGQVTPVDPAVEKWKSEASKTRDLWDKSRLESTLYDKRYKRAYDRWVKAAKDKKAQALAKRDQASGEFKLSLERRRLAWYRFESAKARQAAAEAESQAKGIGEDIRRVEERIRKMEQGLGIQPTPTVGTGR